MRIPRARTLFVMLAVIVGVQAVVLWPGCATGGPGGEPITPDQQAKRRALALVATVPIFAALTQSDDAAVAAAARTQLKADLNELGALLSIGPLGGDVLDLLLAYEQSGKWSEAEWMALATLIRNWAAPAPAPPAP